MMMKEKMKQIPQSYYLKFTTRYLEPTKDITRAPNDKNTVYIRLRQEASTELKNQGKDIDLLYIILEQHYLKC